MNAINDPRTPEEIEESCCLWAEELKDLIGKSVWDVIREDERDHAEEQRDIEADARWYFGH